MIKFVIDSTFGLDDEFLKENDIQVANLKLTFEDDVVDEGGIDTWNDIYEKIENSSVIPMTSQPNAENFINCINYHKQKNSNCTVFILVLSSQISGAINSAKIASSEFEDGSVVVVDSKVCGPLGNIITRELVGMAKAGASTEQLLKKVEDFQANTKLLIMPHNLSYFKKGGRLNSFTYLISNTLSIKPLVGFLDGKLLALKKAIGDKMGLKMLASLVQNSKQKVFLAYVKASKYLEKLKEMLSESFVKISNIFPVDPVIGCHIGPGGVAIATVNDGILTHCYN